MNTTLPLSIRGKRIDTKELEYIRAMTEQSVVSNRSQLSYLVCKQFNWVQPNGKLQDTAARDILRRLEQMGWIRLPIARHGGSGRPKRAEEFLQSELELFSVSIEGQFSSNNKIELELIKDKQGSRAFGRMINRYHYLGYCPLVGRSVRYLVWLDGQVVGGISWGSASWKLGARDRYIGWDVQTRQQNLQRLAGNHRFLILPWVRIKNLASATLSLAIRKVKEDWQTLYGIELELLESFVDISRFKGSCYKAANWNYLGQSQGSSKSGNSYSYHGQVKDIYVYPLRKDFKERLCAR